MRKLSKVWDFFLKCFMEILNSNLDHALAASDLNLSQVNGSFSLGSESGHFQH